MSLRWQLEEVPEMWVISTVSPSFAGWKESSHNISLEFILTRPLAIPQNVLATHVCGRIELD